MRSRCRANDDVIEIPAIALKSMAPNCKRWLLANRRRRMLRRLAHKKAAGRFSYPAADHRSLLKNIGATIWRSNDDRRSGNDNDEGNEGSA